MSDYPESITVRELIRQLQELPEADKDKEVLCGYDGLCLTGVYGIAKVDETTVQLSGD